jgi:hypothetical protein
VEIPPLKWRRLGRRAALGIAAGVGAFAATAALALTRGGGAGPTALPLSSLSALGHLDPAGAAGLLGPEGVPIPAGAALGRARKLTTGEQIDGITCQSREKVLWHTHAHLTIFVHGTARQIPAGIGIGPPRQVAATPRGAFVVAGSCFAWLHTHSADGIIHTESPITRTYTLGEFFDIWGQPLDRERVGPAHGAVTAYVNGRVYTGNPRRIALLAHAQIQLDVDTPRPPPARITFPAGL